MRQWRKDWPESYHQMLWVLREKWPEGGRGVQEFVRVLRLHEQYPAHLVQHAIEQALAWLSAPGWGAALLAPTKF
jgi:hypothetical protein